MRTEIITYDDLENTNMKVLLKRYWGGEDDGTCYQISENNAPFHYINLTDKELWYLIYRRIKQDHDDMQEKDTLYDGHIKYINAVKPLMEYLEKKYRFEAEKDE